MRLNILILLMIWPVIGAAAPGLMIIGGADEPVGFVIQPLSYEGQGLSPAVEIENSLVAYLSQSGLFYQPWGTQTDKQQSLSHWLLEDVRYLISGRIEETEQAMHLHLMVTDTLGTTPTRVWVELNIDAWQQAVHVFARQLFYSLFYATYTDDIEGQYLDTTRVDETRYWVRLVQTVKHHWQNRSSTGQCQVEVSQFPGGRVQSYAIQKACDEPLGEEVRTLFEHLDQLPYRGFNAPFEKDLRFTFVARG